MNVSRQKLKAWLQEFVHAATPEPITPGLYVERQVIDPYGTWLVFTHPAIHYFELKPSFEWRVATFASVPWVFVPDEAVIPPFAEGGIVSLHLLTHYIWTLPRWPHVADWYGPPDRLSGPFPPVDRMFL